MGFATSATVLILTASNAAAPPIAVSALSVLPLHCAIPASLATMKLQRIP